MLPGSLACLLCCFLPSQNFGRVKTENKSFPEFRIVSTALLHSFVFGSVCGAVKCFINPYKLQFGTVPGVFAFGDFIDVAAFIVR